MRGIYLVGGYPDNEKFSDCLRAVAETGFDFVEIGIPFNDPVADGPVIAQAIHRASGNGISVDSIIDNLETLEKRRIVIYIMTYSNIVYSYGLEKFADRCRGSVRGVIVADLPNRMHPFFYQNGLDLQIIPFATLESGKTDIAVLKYMNCDFIYFVGLRGITGSSADLGSEELMGKIAQVRDTTGKKVVLGFGIKTGDDAAQALRIADGFVVGTEAVRRQEDPAALREYLKELQCG